MRQHASATDVPDLGYLHGNYGLDMFICSALCHFILYINSVRAFATSGSRLLNFSGVFILRLVPWRFAH